MGPGHFALAYAAKRITPRTNLGVLFLSVEFLDFLWPLFVLMGIEHFRIVPGLMAASSFDFTDYPWSHSLLMSVAWGAAFALVYLAITRNRIGAWVVGLGVPSHWVLDWIVHRPDLPLWPGGGPKLGLGLWNHLYLSSAVELVMLLIGFWIYTRSTRPRDRIGRFGFWLLTVLVLLLWTSTLSSATPPTPRAVALAALGLWLFVLVAWWVDRHRVPSGPGSA